MSLKSNYEGSYMGKLQISHYMHLLYTKLKLKRGDRIIHNEQKLYIH